MTATISIKVEGAEALIAALGINNILRPVIWAVAEHLLGQVRNYPKQDVGRPAIWSRNAERRKRQMAGFFARLRSGEITVPYIRTSALAKRWAVYTSMGGLEATLVNNTPYGPLVQDREEQTRFHDLTGWDTVDEVVESEQVHVSNLANALTQAVLGSI